MALVRQSAIIINKRAILPKTISNIQKTIINLGNIHAND